ncbi:MAG: hypothetical protein RLZZ563_1218 [Pseudomonadota bacterium]|jgi:Zn-finger nucleic acid-binding protein
MKCPVDDETLVMADRNGIEIDYCPKCRGVWLDRGELDKIIERAGTAQPVAATPPPPPPQAAGYTQPAPPPPPGYAPQGYGRPKYDSDDRNSDEYYRKHGYHKKRKSLLGEIFDF